MKLKSLLFAGAAAVIGTAGAQAQTYQGLYGSIGAGLTEILEDRDFETPGEGLVTPVDSELDYDDGIGVSSAIGYAFGNGFRSELEFTYRQNDARFVAPDFVNGQLGGFSGFPASGLTGEAKSYGFMANLLYDFHQIKQNNSKLPITPYIGGGVGALIADIEIAASNPSAINGLTPLSIDDSRGLLAAQGIAGVGIELAENLVLDLSYRYLATTKRQFDGAFAGFDSTVNTNLDSHNFFAGLRWNFGAAPIAAAAAAPAIIYKDCWDGSSVPRTSSCPPQIEEETSETPDPIQTIVYFDFDKSNLTPEASSLIREAVSRARQFDVERVRVVGNTDTSGSSAYNQALSERRARVVRDALVAEGIPAGIISSQSLGESSPAKSTPDGTREPLNRRTEITILFE